MKLSKAPLLAINPLELRATGSGVTEIDVLPKNLSDSKILYISDNNISKLDNIEQFKHLEVLSINSNRIKWIEELYRLSELKKLTNCSLIGNPVTELPMWNIHILKVCPSIKILNGKRVGQYDYGIIDQEKVFLDYCTQIFVMNMALSVLVDSYENAFNLCFPVPSDINDFYYMIRKKFSGNSPSEYLSKLGEYSKIQLDSFQRSLLNEISDSSSYKNLFDERLGIKEQLDNLVLKIPQISNRVSSTHKSPISKQPTVKTLYTIRQSPAKSCYKDPLDYLSRNDDARSSRTCKSVISKRKFNCNKPVSRKIVNSIDDDADSYKEIQRIELDDIKPAETLDMTQKEIVEPNKVDEPVVVYQNIPTSPITEMKIDDSNYLFKYFNVWKLKRSFVPECELNTIPLFDRIKSIKEKHRLDYQKRQHQGVLKLTEDRINQMRNEYVSKILN